MKRIIQSIIEQIFPSISISKANKLLKKKINSEKSQSNISDKENFDVIPIESFRQKYTETFNIKNKFEDKAKTNVVGITIAITIIMGASGLIDSLIRKYTSVPLHWISFILLSISIIYLLVSGIDAIRVLFNENTMSIVDLPDLSADDIGTKEKYDDYTNRNINRNIVRNNIVYSSYICIRNALICMMVLFILVSIPFSDIREKVGTGMVTNNSSISYSSDIIIPERISRSTINNSITIDKSTREDIKDGETYTFVNMDEKYLVEYKCVGTNIIVQTFSTFDKVINNQSNQ